MPFLQLYFRSRAHIGLLFLSYRLAYSALDWRASIRRLALKSPRVSMSCWNISYLRSANMPFSSFKCTDPGTPIHAHPHPHPGSSITGQCLIYSLFLLRKHVKDDPSHLYPRPQKCHPFPCITHHYHHHPPHPWPTTSLPLPPYPSWTATYPS